MALTDAQLTILAQKRRANPPTYFDSNSGKRISVGGDIEDAMILASTEIKAKAAAYINLLLNSNSSSSDYGDLLGEFLEKQAQNSAAKKAEVDAILQKFTTFKDGLTQGAAEEPFTTGMQPLLKALNRGVGRLNYQSNRYDFANDFDETGKTFFASTLTDSEKEELRSWLRVVLAY